MLVQMAIVSELQAYTFCGYTIKHPVHDAAGCHFHKRKRDFKCLRSLTLTLGSKKPTSSTESPRSSTFDVSFLKLMKTGRNYINKIV